MLRLLLALSGTGPLPPRSIRSRSAGLDPADHAELRRSSGHPIRSRSMYALWARSITPSGVVRAAMLAFFVPSVELGLDQTKYSQSFFNPADPGESDQHTGGGTGQRQLRDLQLPEVHRGLAHESRVASAQAGELEQRFRAALETESSYYDVLVNQELSRVNGRAGSTRARGTGNGAGPGHFRGRGPDRFAPAGAGADAGPGRRFTPGERASHCSTRAGAQGRCLRSRRRRAPEPLPLPALPITLPEALRSALDQGPHVPCRAGQRELGRGRPSGAARRISAGPQCHGLHQRYDSELFPNASNVNSLSFSLSFPLWNNGQREIEATRARVNRDVARTIREDLERVVRRDVTSSFDNYRTSAARCSSPRWGSPSPHRTIECRSCVTAPVPARFSICSMHRSTLHRLRPTWCRPAIRPGSHWLSSRPYSAEDYSRTRKPRETDACGIDDCRDGWLQQG